MKKQVKGTGAAMLAIALTAGMCVSIGVTATGAAFTLPAAKPASLKPSYVISDEEAGYSQADYDACVDSADDEQDCEEIAYQAFQRLCSEGKVLCVSR